MKQHISKIILAAIFLLTGIIILLYPSNFLKFLLMIFLAYELIEAVIFSVTVFKNKSFIKTNLTKTAINLIGAIALFVLLLKSDAQNISNLIIYFVAGLIFLNSAIELYLALAINKKNANSVAYVNPTLTLIISLVMFLIPNLITGMIFSIIAFVLIAIGILMILRIVLAMKKDKQTIIIEEDK